MHPSLSRIYCVLYMFYDDLPLNNVRLDEALNSNIQIYRRPLAFDDTPNRAILAWLFYRKSNTINLVRI